VERALSSGAVPETGLTGLIGSALEDIGAGWARGELSVADEHRASTVATRVVSRLGARFLPRGPKRGTVVLAAPEGELHSVPISMAADVLRWHGFAVIDLGADTPADALAEAAGGEPSLVAVGLACTGWLALEAAPDAVAAVHEAVPQVPVLLGGGAVASAEDAARLGPITIPAGWQANCFAPSRS
jgi:MerR family transcriptional regulator, light-induced transcriptional regulator